MKTAVKFSKISFERFKIDWIDTFYKDTFYTLPDTRKVNVLNNIKLIYDRIKLPERSTSRSAGYDFFAPSYFDLPFNSSVKIPTGIKAEIDSGYFVAMYPRSSYGFKYGIELSNTVGIIDEDYYNNSNNEGHIFCKLVNKDESVGKDLRIEPEDRFCQGIVIPYAISYDDNATGERTGGIGSTGN